MSSLFSTADGGETAGRLGVTYQRKGGSGVNLILPRQLVLTTDSPLRSAGGMTVVDLMEIALLAPPGRGIIILIRTIITP